MFSYTERSTLMRKFPAKIRELKVQLRDISCHAKTIENPRDTWEFSRVFNKQSLKLKNEEFFNLALN